MSVDVTISVTIGTLKKVKSLTYTKQLTLRTDKGWVSEKS